MFDKQKIHKKDLDKLLDKFPKEKEKLKKKKKKKGWYVWIKI